MIQNQTPMSKMKTLLYRARQHLLGAYAKIVLNISWSFLKVLELSDAAVTLLQIRMIPLSQALGQKSHSPNGKDSLATGQDYLQL